MIHYKIKSKKTRAREQRAEEIKVILSNIALGLLIGFIIGLYLTGKWY